MCIHIRAQLLALDHCWSISTGSCLTTFLTALISLRATTVCLPTWRAGWDHSASTIKRRRWKLSERGWVRRRHIYLTHTYKNLFPYTTSASIPVATTLRSNLSMYVFLYITISFYCFFVNTSLEVIFRITLVLKLCSCFRLIKVTHFTTKRVRSRYIGGFSTMPALLLDALQLLMLFTGT
jgi:hypothetical protein